MKINFISYDNAILENGWFSVLKPNGEEVQVFKPHHISQDVKEVFSFTPLRRILTEQRAWLMTPRVNNAAFRNLPRHLNAHSHLASGYYNKSRDRVRQGLTVVPPKTSDGIDPCLFSHHVRLMINSRSMILLRDNPPLGFKYLILELKKLLG